MRLYSDCPDAAMSMHADPRLHDLLRATIADHAITKAVETGTYLGLGSTTMLANCLSAHGSFELVTMEVNWENWRRARGNLARFPSVRCLWGLSVDYNEAVRFLRSDEMLRNHAQYDSIYIDDTVDPIAFYMRELKGSVGGSPSLPRRLLAKRLVDRALGRYRGDGLLAPLLARYKDARPLILLDSAGALGYLEFQTLMRAMGRACFWLLLDDVHHIKHYRSVQRIRSDPSFQILGCDDTHGWVFAQHN